MLLLSLEDAERGHALLAAAEQFDWKSFAKRVKAPGTHCRVVSETNHCRHCTHMRKDHAGERCLCLPTKFSAVLRLTAYRVSWHHPTKQLTIEEVSPASPNPDMWVPPLEVVGVQRIIEHCNPGGGPCSTQWSYW